MNEIRLCNIEKSYDGHSVLRNFSANIAPGSRTAFMGPSGVGKTTLLRLLLGLEKPDAGTIEGVQNIQYCPVFQENRLCAQLTAVGNVALVLPHDGQQRIPPALAEVGLPGEEQQKPVTQLSGGQKRRVALVRAVEAQGDVLVLDEAFKGLDEQTKQLCYQYCLNHLKGRTLIVVTHDIEEAKALGAQPFFMDYPQA